MKCKITFKAGNGDVSTHPLPKSSAAPACLVSPPLNPFYQHTLHFSSNFPNKIEPVFKITSLCSLKYAAIDKLSNSQLNPTGGQVPLSGETHALYFNEQSTEFLRCLMISNLRLKGEASGGKYTGD